MEALGVRRTGFLPHREALQRAAASHLNVCILSALPGAERILPQKIFELAYLRRPVLTLSPPGELADLAQRLALGPVIHPDDHPAIARELEKRVLEFQSGVPFAPVGSSIDLTPFDRRAIAARFAGIFANACDRARPGGERAKARATSEDAGAARVQLDRNGPA